MVALTDKFVIDESWEGIRIDYFLHHLFPHLSKSVLKKNLNLLKVDNKASKLGHKLKSGQVLEYEIREFKNNNNQPHFSLSDIDILYEDRDIWVINKPIGIKVTPAYNGDGDCLAKVLADKIKDLHLFPETWRAGVVHRLDRETSGCLVMVKNIRSYKHLVNQFKKQQVEKKYLALLSGELLVAEGELNYPIGMGKKYNTRRVCSDGQSAMTRFQVLERYKGASYVQIQLQTGRTHQIRVHFSHYGFPVMGDKLYSTKNNSIEPLYLHAWTLRFTHPINKKRLEFEAKMPQYFKDKIHQLENVHQKRN